MKSITINFFNLYFSGNAQSDVDYRLYSKRTPGYALFLAFQNNQIALDTPPVNQSNVELWADKAVAMGIPSWTIDGSDPASWHASVACAREFSFMDVGCRISDNFGFYFIGLQKTQG